MQKLNWKTLPIVTQEIYDPPHRLIVAMVYISTAYVLYIIQNLPVISANISRGLGAIVCVSDHRCLSNPRRSSILWNITAP